MTIDEVIKHCEEVAKKHTKYNIYGGFESCDECSDEHRQLAEWLKELKAVKQIIVQHDSDSMPEDYWYIDQIREVVQGVDK